MGKYRELIKEKIEKLKESGAFHIIVGSFLTKFVSFFGSIFIVRFLTKSEYGILGYYENFMGYFLILAGYGLDTATLRYIVLADDAAGKKACYLNAFRKGTAWNAVLLVFSALFLFFYPHKEAFAHQFPVALCLVGCIPFIFLQNVSLCTMRGLYENRLYAYIAFGIAFLQIAARVLGAAAGGLRLTVTTRFLAEMLCGAGCVIFVLKRLFPFRSSETMEKKSAHEMNVYAVQIMLTNGLWTIFMLNDIFLLGQFTGDEVILADYKIAYVIPANLSILVAAVGVFVAPYFTKYDKEKNYAWIREKLKLVLLITSSIMAAVVMVCFVLAKPLITLIFGSEYVTAVPVMRLLLIASFFNNGVRATIANVLSSIGEQKTNLIVAGFGMAIQIVLDCLLIPTFGGTGVAISSTIAYLFMSLALGSVIWKRYYANRAQA